MSIKTFIKGHAGLATFLAIIVIIVGVVGGRLATRKPVESSLQNTKRVTLVDAKTFRDDLTTVNVEGVVESVAQADIKSQVSSPVATVYVSVGDSVAAGQTLVELQNNDIRAQLDQARANLLLAEGVYNAGGVTTDVALKASVDKIRDAYTRSDDIFHGQINQFLFNQNPNTTQLQSLILDSNIKNTLSLEWTSTDASLSDWKKSVNALNDASTKEQIAVILGVSQKSLSTLGAFLDTVSAALNNATRGASQSDIILINGWKATTNAARSTVSSLISSLTTSVSSISANQAQIQAAEAGVKNLEAQLAKTIIKSPISGKVAALPLRQGEFATVGQLIASVVGTGGLQIKAYASSEDLDRLATGAAVTVEGSIPGTVITVAPSVSQTTKKIEVKINVPNAGSSLVVGQSVQAKIQTTKPRTSAVPKEAVYILPIQDVKILPDATYVYTVDSNSKIVKNQVTLGDVKGDYVEVKTGLTDDMKIISPVYELNEGEVVSTQ